jgi:hypothetical protein
LQDSIAPGLAALIAFHPGAELVERHGAQHRDPLAEHPERHPHGALAAPAPDPWVTFGLKLGDSSVVCHPWIKARSSGQANPIVLRDLSLKIRRGLPLLAAIALDNLTMRTLAVIFVLALITIAFEIYSDAALTSAEVSHTAAPDL